eukprot:1721224-Rhodomonas_salina.1
MSAMHDTCKSASLLSFLRFGKDVGAGRTVVCVEQNSRELGAGAVVGRDEPLCTATLIARMRHERTQQGALHRANALTVALLSFPPPASRAFWVTQHAQTQVTSHRLQRRMRARRARAVTQHEQTQVTSHVCVAGGGQGHAAGGQGQGFQPACDRRQKAGGGGCSTGLHTTPGLVYPQVLV